MHQLLEHFEESHVLVIGQDGRPVYPRSSPSGAGPSRSPSSTSSPFTSRKGYSSVVVSYPQPHPPLPMDATLPPNADAALSLQSSHSHTTPPNQPNHPPDVLADFDPFDMDTGTDTTSPESLSPPSSVFSSPDPNVPVCLPPALLSIRPQSPQDCVMGDARQIWDGTDVGLGKMPVGRGGSFEVNGRRTKIIECPPSPSRKRDREKMYKCPVSLRSPSSLIRLLTLPGRLFVVFSYSIPVVPRLVHCLFLMSSTLNVFAPTTQSYLNPNGLKYHLEKGTCTIDPVTLASAHTRTLDPPTTPFQVTN